MLPALARGSTVNMPHLRTGRGMSCQERDKIILAFLLAVNERNNASSDLETATDESERAEARRIVESARGYCHRLRDQVLVHCQQCGC